MDMEASNGYIASKYVFAYGHIQDNIFVTHKSLLKGIFEGFYACQVHSKVNILNIF